MNPAFYTALSLFILMAACGEPSSKSSDKKIGGCLYDTVPLGLSMQRQAPPSREAGRVDILSLKDAGEECYKKAAAELTSALDSLGIELYTRSDLVRLKKGPCWPPYRISFRIGFKGKDDAERLKSYLLDGSLAGLIPSESKAEDYGTIFVTAGFGSSDWWTVWYSPARGRPAGQ